MAGCGTTDEGILLRKSGILAPILILAPIPVQRIKDAIHYDLRLTVCTLEDYRLFPRLHKLRVKPSEGAYKGGYGNGSGLGFSSMKSCLLSAGL